MYPYHSLNQVPGHGIKYLFVYIGCLQQRISYRQKLWCFLQALRKLPGVGVLIFPDGFIVRYTSVLGYYGNSI